MNQQKEALLRHLRGNEKDITLLGEGGSFYVLESNSLEVVYKVSKKTREAIMDTIPEETVEEVIHASISKYRNIFPNNTLETKIITNDSPYIIIEQEKCESPLSKTNPITIEKEELKKIIELYQVAFDASKEGKHIDLGGKKTDGIYKILRFLMKNTPGLRPVFLMIILIMETLSSENILYKNNKLYFADDIDPFTKTPFNDQKTPQKKRNISINIALNTFKFILFLKNIDFSSLKVETLSTEKYLKNH